MNKEELLRCVKEKIGKLSIKFPLRIDLQENNHVITLTMLDGMAKNMQDDSAAFEGWILCLKAAMDTEGEKYRFILDWNEAETENPHYQRFLYRVNKFTEFFGGNDGWFSVKTTQRLDASKVKYNSGEKYALNCPMPGNRINDSDASEENYLENEIVRRQKDLEYLKQICPVDYWRRQLPVGVFKQNVKKDGAIFTCGKSAIDLWGIKGECLYILELKAEGNYKVGVLSEIFFYVMVLQDEQARRFVREKSEEGESIRNTDKIKAFILAPELHPFITPKVFDLLNEKSINQKMEFGYIRFAYVETEHKLRFNSFERLY